MVYIASNYILSNHANYTPPMRTSLSYTLDAAKQGTATVLLTLWKVPNFGRAPSASLPRVL